MDDDELQRQLGQLLLINVDGSTAHDDIKRLICAPFYIGGVVLSRLNGASAEQIISLVNGLQRTARDAGHAQPLFICIDKDSCFDAAPGPSIVPQEGWLPTLRTTNTCEDTLQATTTAGEILRALGGNMHFTDICNVNSKPSRPGTRLELSGDDVGRLVAATLRGFRSRGIMSCLRDSRGLNLVRSSELPSAAFSDHKEFLESQLIPYRRAIAEDVEAILTEDIAVPDVDSALPVAPEKHAVQVLRDNLQYKGLMISGYPKSNTIRSKFNVAESAISSFRAGNDCAIISNNLEEQITSFQQVLIASKDGEIPLSQISESLERVKKLKDTFISWESTLEMRPVSDLEVVCALDKMSSAVTTCHLLQPPHIPIEPFEPCKDMAELITLWHSLLPQYAVPGDRLSDLLTRPNGAHFRVRLGQQFIGFVATFVNEDRPTSYISALLVHRAHQSRGVGAALIRHAQKHLRSASKARTVTVGSSFPRFWPGVPLDIPAKPQLFFINRGFCPAPGPTARDYWVKLATYEVPAAILERAAKAGVNFMPWREDQYGECMARQKELFGGDQVWIGAYERLAQAGQHHQAMVAVDSAGNQVGWALMMESGIGLSKDLAFPPLLGEQTGQIGCVGVHPDARNKGLGLALVVHAALDLRRRGMEQVFIDWVTLINWYERAGFEVWREYRTMALNHVF
ncbi:beta-N-acetylhexosaminidase [Blastomyces parvus]|uniref:Beta-N-acetylhexosaminidase n=1 Tax=Blastomyces parvus TaxID=2060905 RepID=A0A2B7X367_9EURO|nr:beta-N-acetylhexosaminidase [Blastomyces parvus]